MSINISEEVLFLNPVYTGLIPSVSNSLIKDEIFAYQNIDTGRNISNIGGWQSKDFSEDLENFPETKKLVEEIISGMQDVYSLWGFNNPPILDNFWFNVNKKNSFNMSHTHPNSKFSAVYYVRCNENSGDICFNRSDLQPHYFIGDDDKNIYTFTRYCYTPVESQFIFFPSFMPHYVNINDSDSDRISIAFNFN